MTREEKELLLRDLCARLPYRVKGIITYDKSNTIFTVEGIDNNVLHLSNAEECYIEDIKLYLRPMSSMTEEEKRQYMGFIAYSGNPNGSANFVDWLNEHHFDYRTTYDESKEKWVSMIEKGLAIEVTEENNPYK